MIPFVVYAVRAFLICTVIGICLYFFPIITIVLFIAAVIVFIIGYNQ